MCWTTYPTIMKCGHDGADVRVTSSHCRSDAWLYGCSTRRYRDSSRCDDPCDDCIADGAWRRVRLDRSGWERAPAEPARAYELTVRRRRRSSACEHEYREREYSRTRISLRMRC